jgi:hypothetical protein
MTEVKRVSTREFLRNINLMTDPVEVYTRAEHKGTWLPAGVEWQFAGGVKTTDPAALVEDLKHLKRTLAAVRTAQESVFGSVPTSRPQSVTADQPAGFGQARPAPKPSAAKRKKSG